MKSRNDKIYLRNASIFIQQVYHNADIVRSMFISTFQHSTNPAAGGVLSTSRWAGISSD